jgi:hypothetical protein
LPVKQVDDEGDHDRTSLFDRTPLEQIAVSGWFRSGRKMGSSAANRCRRTSLPGLIQIKQWTGIDA